MEEVKKKKDTPPCLGRRRIGTKATQEQSLMMMRKRHMCDISITNQLETLKRIVTRRLSAPGKSRCRKDEELSHYIE